MLQHKQGFAIRHCKCMENFGPIANHADCLVSPDRNDPLRVQKYDNPLNRQVRQSRRANAFIGR